MQASCEIGGVKYLWNVTWGRTAKQIRAEMVLVIKGRRAFRRMTDSELYAEMSWCNYRANRQRAIREFKRRNAIAHSPTI